MGVSQRVKSLYTDMYAQGAERAWRDYGAIDKAANIARLYGESSLPAKPSVIEIGCGEGAIAQAMHDIDFYGDYRGYDLSKSGIEEARMRNVPGATFAVIDGDAIPEPDNATDLVILSHVVEHLEHPRKLLYEAHRIGHYALIEVPLELHQRTPRDYSWSAVGHINKYNSLSIRHLVQTCNFTVIRQVTTNPHQPPDAHHRTQIRKRAQWLIKDALLRCAPGIGRSLFTYHETILATGENSDDVSARE